jgi:hypothetical protein
MKTNNHFFLIAILSVGLFAMTSAPFCRADGDDDPLTIFVGEPGVGDTPIIRSPALIPISAYYYSSLSTILVNCSIDLGSMTVEIENITTGSLSRTTIEATHGVHPFAISGDVGIYEITFTLSGGHEYIGSFEIE